MKKLISVLLVCGMLSPVAAGNDMVRAHSISIVAESEAPAARAVAGHLERRLLQTSELAIRIGASFDGTDGLAIRLGINRNDAALPSRKGVVFAEGYTVRTELGEGGNTIVGVGADARGLLYAAGEIVRRLQYGADYVEVSPFEVSASPAYRFRGFSANQGGTMRNVTGARAWRDDELQDVVLEYALAGANTFYSADHGGPFYDFMKRYDLMTVTGARPNQLHGEFPEAWKAHGREAWEGTQWVCPSVPEARAALLAQWREDFAARAPHDVMRFYAGDPGGCACKECEPFGKTFVELSAEMAQIWLELHPNSVVQIANQGLTNAGDQAILDYLNAEPRPWCYGICYGPGSNAMSPYFRDIDMRDDLFEYAGMGPVNRYLAELHRGLPQDQRIVHYSDITHYISAQYAMPDPEPNLVRSYGRRTFHARPVAMYRIFQQIMPFSEGDIIYSEGNHDEFHQYMWNRLLFDPNRTLEDVMLEYCTLYFGPEAAPTMLEALLQLERNMGAPLAENEGIGRYYGLVREAGERIPAWRLARDWRWHMHMQKAVLDSYIQLKLRGELDKERRARALVEPVLAQGPILAAVDQALAVLGAPAESDAMRALREEAQRLADITNERHGDRVSGLARLDQPLRPLADEIRLLKEARSAERGGREKLRSALRLMDTPTRPGRIFW